MGDAREKGRRRRGTGSRANIRRVLPVLLVFLFCAYALWFTNAATNRSEVQPVVHQPSVDVADNADQGRVEEDQAKAPQQQSDPWQLQPQPQQPEPLHGEANRHEPQAESTDSEACKGRRKPPTTCGYFPEGASLELQPSTEPLERDYMSVSAWVFLEGAQHDGEVMSIQTILSNKESGCATGVEHAGFSLFVNEWNTNSGQLYVSWGNEQSGCEELASITNCVTPGRWTFVVAAFDGTAAMLYADGKLVAHSGRGLGRMRISHTSGQVTRQRQPSGRIRVGMHPDGTHALRGYLADVSFYPTALTEGQVSSLYDCPNSRVVSPLLQLGFPKTGPEITPSTGVAEVIPGSGNIDALLSRHASVAVPTMSRLKDSDSSRPADGSHGAPREGRPTFNRQPPDAVGDEPAEGWPLRWLKNPPAVNVSAEARAASDREAAIRLEHVRASFKRAWSAYRKYAWGADEIKPVSNKSHNWLHLGATLIDCLDNLWLFDMKEEFAEAQEWVATQMNLRRAASVSMFETVIRILGGLLSAFELSREPTFLRKAQEVADHMMYAFEASPHGLPCATISFSGSKPCTFAAWSGHSAILAEYGTIQLEFKYLAHHTGHKKYWEVAEKPMRLLRAASKPHDLYPTFVNPQTGKWTSQKFTFGALADSFYEYLIKQWLITNKKEEYLREMFDQSMIGMANLLVQRSKPSGFVYIADWTGAALSHKMDHLACFAGAMLAIAAQDGYKYDKEYMALAVAIGDTCYEMYRRTQTGLASEYVVFPNGNDMTTPKPAPFNIGRPEAVETFFVLWYYTRDPKWRDIGWEVFKAFERHSATGSGWTTVPDVENPRRRREDRMESFVLAETMKYLFLLFNNDYPVPLEKYVINTEAHPLGRFDPIVTSSST